MQDESTRGLRRRGSYSLWLYADAQLAHSLVHLAFDCRPAVRRSMRFYRARTRGTAAATTARRACARTTARSITRAFLFDPDGNNVEAVCLK